MTRTFYLLSFCFLLKPFNELQWLFSLVEQTSVYSVPTGFPNYWLLLFNNQILINIIFVFIPPNYLLLVSFPCSFVGFFLFIAAVVVVVTVVIVVVLYSWFVPWRECDVKVSYTIVLVLMSVWGPITSLCINVDSPLFCVNEYLVILMY